MRKVGFLGRRHQIASEWSFQPILASWNCFCFYSAIDFTKKGNFGKVVILMDVYCFYLCLWKHNAIVITIWKSENKLPALLCGYETNFKENLVYFPLRIKLWYLYFTHLKCVTSGQIKSQSLIPTCFSFYIAKIYPTKRILTFTIFWIFFSYIGGNWQIEAKLGGGTLFRIKCIEGVK